MYVCLCKGVTCSQINAAVDEGRACRMRDLARELGVATQCGRCAQCAQGLLRTGLERLAEATTIPAASAEALAGTA